MIRSKVSFLVAQIWVNFNEYVMSRRLSEITPQYSSFLDDQVLTSAKLNEFMEYFDEQDRLSRVCLTGVGIACGFQINYNASTSVITINQGCGITTDGDLIILQKAAEESNEAATGNSFKDIHEIVSGNITYTHSKVFIDDNAQYLPFQDEETIISMQELVSDEDSENDADALPLLPSILADKVVVLYLECYKKDADICTTTNCDNQGQPNIQNLKVLLIAKDDVENIVNNRDTIFNKHNIYEAILKLPRTAVKRVILKGEGGGNNNISTYDKIAKEYKTKITNAKNTLSSAYGDLFLGFSELLDIPNSVSSSILSQIDAFDDFSNDRRIQYRYSLAKNVSDTFNEIADLLLQLKVECCPDISAFPKHLLLGCLESEKVYSEFRHDFYHSPANNDYQTIIRKVKSLVKRLRLMLKNFNLNNAQNMDITPSLSCGSLGEKAIPVYFDIDASLLKAWDFYKTENFKEGYNLSFHKSLLAPESYVQNPLNFELDCSDLYRIEGLFGESPEQSKNFVENIKLDKGLDFDCILFDINENIEEFSAFVRKHPSISHKGGVPKGGTFIIISDRKEVLADFSISYKIAEESNAIGCCKLVECSYPWISSLKYLNNLSRSLLGTQSKNNLMPKEYVFTVLSYKINGQPLISSQQVIRIPLEDIFLRRMHSVTAALNNKFPEGVVFDYNEDQKRLLITKAKEDTFAIRFKESSLNTNNAVYSYTNTGLYRNNKVFRLKSMICRDVDGAKASFYRSLHKQYDPSITKDDDYGAYDEKWARWTHLTFKVLPNHSLFVEQKNPRFKTSLNDFVGPERERLDKIIRDIKKEIGKEGGVAMDGDWVNGTWVDKSMRDYYNKNSANLNDPIVEYINLRELLHEKSKSKITKFSIYITGTDYNPKFDTLITTYCYDADIYFAMPTGPNRLTRL
jgi:hypothetical protein